MRGKTTRVSLQSRHTIKQWAYTENYSQGLQLLQRKSSMHWQTTFYVYEVFTAKVGKVAGEGKIVRSGSEVITSSFDWG